MYYQHFKFLRLFNFCASAAAPSNQADKTLPARPLVPVLGLSGLQQLHGVPAAREPLAGAAVVVEPGMHAQAHVHRIDKWRLAGQQLGPRGGSQVREGRQDGSAEHEAEQQATSE